MRTVSPLTTTWLLTGLAALVVVLTRARLRRQAAAGRIRVPVSVARTHTVSGVLATALWVAMLLTDDARLGWVALVFWWITVLAGLLILLRWLPGKGRHATDPTADAWGDGPGLSLLAHVGMLIGVAVLTVFLVLDKIP